MKYESSINMKTLIKEIALQKDFFQHKILKTNADYNAGRIKSKQQQQVTIPKCKKSNTRVFKLKTKVAIITKCEKLLLLQSEIYAQMKLVCLKMTSKYLFIG